jgi:hypothetical protein
MGPRCSSAETQDCHRSYIIAARFGSKFDFYNRKLLNLLAYKHFCRFYACIQNQIIHKHVHVDYNPLKGMLILLLSLKLSIVPYAAGPKVEVTRGQHLPIYRCQTAFHVSLFVGFLISWISLPKKSTKIGTPQIKVISQY